MDWVERHGGEEHVRSVVAKATCWSDVLRALGLRLTGGNPVTVKRWCEQLDIDTSHFDPSVNRTRVQRGRAKPMEEVLVRNSSYSRADLKRRLYDTGLKQRRCELCGQTEEWQGRKLALILDHVNGVGDDNRLENLQIVCPNCAATLDTHCGRNVPRERACVACGKSFAPSSSVHRHCSATCVGQMHGARTRGVPQPHLRKVPRPSHAELLADVAAMPMTAVGAKYGVSDNAVRKWLRAYEREAERTVRQDEAA